MLCLLKKLFAINLEGLGWKIIFYASVVIMVLFFWFRENRYYYKNFIVREVDTDDFRNLSHKIRVELRYGSELTSPENKIWIFGSNDYPAKIGLFEFIPDSIIDSKHFSKSMEESYKQIVDDIQIQPEEFVAFNVSTTENLPAYRVKIEMDGGTSWIDIRDQLRYGTTANDQNKVRFKQDFISFLKSKITG